MSMLVCQLQGKLLRRKLLEIIPESKRPAALPRHAMLYAWMQPQLGSINACVHVLVKVVQLTDWYSDSGTLADHCCAC